MEIIRINKYLSEAGVCSRRGADKLIEEGRVTINGILALLGSTVSEGDEVRLDNKLISGSAKKVLIAFNKPRGIVCTTKDPKSKDVNIVEYINHTERIFPVGRLDKDSEGLILLSNDGDLSNKIMKARNYHEKEYEVEVDKPFDDEFLKKMSEGVPILDTVTRKCKLKRTGKTSFNIILTQGLNRQIRRMCEYFGYRVVKLKRIRIMNIKLGNLKSGTYRDVTEEEYNELVKGLR